jgi:cellulose synthase/poly-beta-1,6-N-acetylglucosamine synthase-like glycosyltransferase
MTDVTVRAPDENGSAPQISVVLPVYNGGKYLVEAIDSILAQTFTDFELIMIDDGSTDSSLNILRAYEKIDTRVRLVTRENRGLATTLNDSIEIARGEWLARMDQDDIALPNRFERQLAWLNETGADISGSWVKRFGSSDKRVVKLRQSNEAIRMEMLFTSPFAHPTVIMRTALVKKLRYDKAWEKAEDYDLWERAAEAGWQMTNLPEVLVLYRVHESQISTSTSVRQHQLSQQIRHRYWKYMFDALQLNTEWIDQVLKIGEPSARQVDMDIVDAAMIELLQYSYGEARSAIFDHLTRLYFRVAADHSDIVARWDNLNRMFARRTSILTKAKLWLVHSLRIRADSSLFSFLRKIHISLL